MTTPLNLERYELGWSTNVTYAFEPQQGLDTDVINEISWWKGEPEWMRRQRQRAYQQFLRKPTPAWVDAKVHGLNFDDIYYYLKPDTEQQQDWEALPQEIADTYEKLGIPQAERQWLSGVTAQMDSEVVYHRNREELDQLGVKFCDMDTALRDYPELVKQYFGTVIPSGDNTFAALNAAAWSGGSFIYVPPGVSCPLPLQAYFRINAQRAGQFERTLIIADVGSDVHYIEGCSAPVWTADALHAAVVEVVVKPGARVTYSTIQNWSRNVFNLVTKRARVEEDGTMEWVDGNAGSAITVKYPSIYLMGRGATGTVTSVAYAGEQQVQDTGAKIVHAADDTQGNIIAKSLSHRGGAATYRGLVRIEKGVRGAHSRVQCDALLMDNQSRSVTLPYMENGSYDGRIEHEATIEKIGAEQLFYLQSRGLTLPEATALIVNGFMEPITKTLPMEYAVEWSRLIELEMDGAVG